MPSPHADVIADCVLNAFHALPSKYKPRKLADGRREWTTLAGVVLSRDAPPTFPRQTTPYLNSNGHSTEPSLTCVALATGMKCLPRHKLAQANGNVLHDWHAEVLAIRAFNRFLVDECADLAKRGFTDGDEGAWVRWRRKQKEHGEQIVSGTKEENIKAGPYFELQEDVSIHMYCSEAPCGDASMELTMAEQEDDTPWESPLPTDGNGMPGRGHFDQLGIVRRKPARPDAPVTLSKSCSDKLAMKQCTGLLSTLTSRLISPERTYLTTLVLPESQYVSSAVQRAFSAKGRIKAIAENTEVQQTWNRSGYGFWPFQVQTTAREFEYSKRSGEDAVVTASNLSALATPQQREILINGVLQGRKQFDPKGASCVSRRRMWEAVLDVANGVGGAEGDVVVMSSETYEEMKRSEQVQAREEVKRQARELALKPWIRNVGDDQWTLHR